MLVFYVSTNASAVLLLFTGKFIIFILSFFITAAYTVAPMWFFLVRR